MILCRSLRVSVFFRRSCSGSRKAILSDNLIVNPCRRHNSLTICWEKSSNLWSLGKTFCTNRNEIAEDYVEDIAGEMSETDDQLGKLMFPEEQQTTEKIFEEISAGDPDKLKQLKLLEFEVALLREGEERVPDRLSQANWKELLGIESAIRRKKLLAFLRLNELKRLSTLQKRIGRHELLLKYREEQGFHYYGLSGHTMFLRVYDKDLNRLLNTRSLMSNYAIVFDCSYQEYMSPLNLKACAKQLYMSVADARFHKFPCRIQLCNFHKEDALGKTLPKYGNAIYDTSFVEIHEKSYLDLYPKDKLVYLTPHCLKTLKNFNHDDVYIIGAFVDKGTGVKASLAKAKQHNIRMARLPIDEYLMWKNGTKSLPLNIVSNILLDMAYYNNWRKAFRHIPQRNLID